MAITEFSAIMESAAYSCTAITTHHHSTFITIKKSYFTTIYLTSNIMTRQCFAMCETRYVAALALCAAGVIVAGCGSVKMSSGDGDNEDATATKYDIAYVDDFTIDPNISSLFSFLLVVNEGEKPLSLQTATVVTYSDDSAGIDWQLTEDATTTIVLKPGHAAGLLSPGTASKLVESGLVPEPIDDNQLDFTMSFPTPPTAGVALHAQAVLRIETTDIVLPFTINIVPSGGPTYNATRRISAQD
jgi:hypothetical protein